MLIIYLPIINVIITQNKQCQYFWQALIMFKEYIFLCVCVSTRYPKEYKSQVLALHYHANDFNNYRRVWKYQIINIKLNELRLFC